MSFETKETPIPDTLNAVTGSILDLHIPDACKDGILANFELLGHHARIVERFEYPVSKAVGEKSE